LFSQSISKFKKKFLRIKVGPAILDSHAKEIVIVGDLTVTSRSIDGVFPKWEFAIPRYFSGEPAQLNPDLLTGFMDAKIMQMGYKKRDRHLAAPISRSMGKLTPHWSN